MPQTVEIRDITPDEVEQVRQSFRDQGASDIELKQQADGKFTLKATFQRDPGAGKDSDALVLPGDPDFPTDPE